MLCYLAKCIILFKSHMKCGAFHLVNISSVSDSTKENEDGPDEEQLKAVTKVSFKAVRKPLSELAGRHNTQQRAPHVVTSRKTTSRKKSKAIPHKQGTYEYLNCSQLFCIHISSLYAKV